MCEEKRLDDNAEWGTRVRLYLIILCDLTLYFMIYLKGKRSTAKLIDHREAGVLSVAAEYVWIYASGRELEIATESI